VTAHYAGYVAWRGLVGEADALEEAAAILCERFTFYEFPNSQALRGLRTGRGGLVKMLVSIWIVRRQSFWDRGRLKIRESLARLICNVMRPADGAASGDWRLSVV
jgi:hypothetical protein